MQDIRLKIREMNEWSETTALKELLDAQPIDKDLRDKIATRAVDLVQRIRTDSTPSLMELFLGEYGLSSDEGVALMCLAEALLRVPDGATMDALIEDKIAPSEWNKHLGQSHSSLINASTWALYMTGKVLNEDESDGIVGVVRNAVKRLGEPVIRQAVARAMKEMGQQFVLGENIQSAMKRAQTLESDGFTYSYDMLGEAARTEADARRYYLSYSQAIGEIAKASNSEDIRENPGISVKLSALHPRYESLQKDRVMDELMPRARSLAILAKSAGIGLNIDAEEAGRLDISLDVIEAIVSEPALAGWDGLGIVVQAYGLRAPAVLDWLYELAKVHDRKLMVRLVKGAYWDTEIKHAQVEGHENFPVFTRKPSTDVSYICCAQKLLGMKDRIYPQFATHNAHTVAAILEMAEDKTAFEFQRLHGMGEALHDTVMRRQSTRCRIYAPVGIHKDLLAYLVRRLLENGANSSFVNQIVDEAVPSSEVAADPFKEVLGYIDDAANDTILRPKNLFQPERPNSRGWDIEDPATLEELSADISKFHTKQYSMAHHSGEAIDIINPANGNVVGKVSLASGADIERAFETLQPWTHISANERADILNAAADLYEKNCDEIFSLLMREAGKTLLDCIGELREAVDFLRYYASQARTHDAEPVGIFACISPWNFPLAIFTGQISAALAAGNGVIAKPAEQTPLIAEFAVRLMKEAGVPDHALQLLLGTGADVGAALTSNPKVGGVCFTGSTQTAKRIDINMAQHLAHHAPFIAETGGLNAMIVDSTALPEQAVEDIIASAFQSAGQRCSALRVLYLQNDVADRFLTMLTGAMDELSLGDPQLFTTDVGPVIDENARAKIINHIEAARSKGKLLKQLDGLENGTFVAPALISVNGIGDLKEEIFGPVLHVATFAAEDLDQIIEDINATGYGLTFGMHSRIDERVQNVTSKVQAGNIYINRNQIGAVVGSQPFGGMGLSGTGPKAGGPKYLKRFYQEPPLQFDHLPGKEALADQINAAFAHLESESSPNAHQNADLSTELPGPTGESNRYGEKPLGRVLCLGPTAEQAEEQAKVALELGCVALAVAPDVTLGIDGEVKATTLQKIEKLDAVVSWSDQNNSFRNALAERDGPIVPLHSQKNFAHWLKVEEHTCIDTTAAGGNAALLAQ